MTTWQSIESADFEPGTIVLLVFDGGTVAPAYWDDGLDCDGNEYDEPGWIWFDQESTGPVDNATHWMPLPPPPGDA